MKEIFRLDGFYSKIMVSYRDANSHKKKLKGLFQELGTQLNFSAVYQPQIYGQIKTVNQVLEYMLGVYVMDKPSK